MSTMVEAEGSVKKKEFVSVSPSVSLFVSRGILIQIFFFVCHGHTYKLFHFVHWFQNSFCCCSRTFPSHAGNFFGTMVDLEGENGPKKPNFKIGLKPTQKC